MQKLDIPMVQAFGVKFHRITFAGIIDHIGRSAAARKPLLIGYSNLHGAYVARNDETLSRFAEACDIFYADGMPLVAWRKLLWGDVGRQHRSTLSQTLPELLAALSERNLKVFYIGSEPSVLEAALVRLRADFPALKIDGHHGYFSKDAGSSENADVLAAVNAFAPDLLMVGMGMPLQERWIIENRHAIAAPVVYATGAAIEYFSGSVARPPSWISNSGFEWAFRLVSQPGKLWRRYLLEPWYLVGPAFSDIAARMRGIRGGAQ